MCNVRPDRLIRVAPVAFRHPDGECMLPISSGVCPPHGELVRAAGYGSLCYTKASWIILDGAALNQG